MGGYWWREARVGAARQFGARHYRKFAVLELMGAGTRQLLRLVVPLFVLAVVVGLGWLGWRSGAAGSLPWRWIASGGGVIVVVYVLARMHALVLGAWFVIFAGVGWLTWYLVTHALAPLLWLAGAAMTVVALAIIARRIRRSRRYRLLDDWID
jgi:hypothetical protein